MDEADELIRRYVQYDQPVAGTATQSSVPPTAFREPSFFESRQKLSSGTLEPQPSQTKVLSPPHRRSRGQMRCVGVRR